jgi:MFS family permease
MNLRIRLELSAMMFIQFFIWGSWYVTGPNYLGTIGFKAEDFGWTYSVGPIAGMLSPFFVGMIADRFFPAQRVLGVMHLAGARPDVVCHGDDALRARHRRRPSTSRSSVTC